MDRAISPRITFFPPIFMRASMMRVKTRSMPRKMKGFATEEGSSKAATPASCMGRARRMAITSTTRSMAGIARTGVLFRISISNLFWYR